MLTLGDLKSDGHRFYPVNKIRAQPVDITVQLRVADALEDFLEDHFQFQTSKVGTHTKMLPDTESPVFVPDILPLNPE